MFFSNMNIPQEQPIWNLYAPGFGAFCLGFFLFHLGLKLTCLGTFHFIH